MSLKQKLLGAYGVGFYSHNIKGQGSETEGCNIPDFPRAGNRGRQAAKSGYTVNPLYLNWAASVHEGWKQVKGIARPGEH